MIRCIVRSFVALGVALTLCPPAGLAEDLKAPDFDLPALGGSRMTSADVVGKGPVLLNFWASWCRPCIMEAPHLVKLYDQYEAKGLEIIGISLDRPSAVARVQAAVTRSKIDYPVLLDPKSEYAAKLKIASLPTNLLLDEQGRIVKTFRGFYPGIEKEIAKAVDGLLAKGESPSPPAAP